eukprot:138082_1
MESTLLILAFLSLCNYCVYASSRKWEDYVSSVLNVSMHMDAFDVDPLNCNASIESICIYSERSLSTPFMTGQYVYDECTNDMAVFKNVHRRTDDITLSTYIQNSTGITFYGLRLGRNQTDPLFMYCLQNEIFDCSMNWMEYYEHEWHSNPMILSFIGSCDAMRSNVSHCSNNANYLEQFCLYGFDAEWGNISLLNGRYTPIGCHNNYPYYRNNDDDIYIYFYYDLVFNDTKIRRGWRARKGFESNMTSIFDNYDTHVIAHCDMEHLRSCSNWRSMAGIRYATWDGLGVSFTECYADTSFHLGLIALILFCTAVSVCILIVIPRQCHLCRKEKSGAQQPDAIEMTVNPETSSAQPTSIESANREEDSDDSQPSLPKSFWIKMVLKCLFTAWDFYTDIALALEWMKGYAVEFENGETCFQNDIKWASYLLFCVSIVGFVGGVGDLVTELLIKNATDTMRRSELEEIQVTCLFYKMFLEDTGSLWISMMVFLLYGTASTTFYVSICTSFMSIFIGTVRRLWTHQIHLRKFHVRLHRTEHPRKCHKWQFHFEEQGRYWAFMLFLIICFLYGICKADSNGASQMSTVWWINGECLGGAAAPFSIKEDHAYLAHDVVFDVRSGNNKVSCSSTYSFSEWNVCNPIYEPEWCNEPLFECRVMTEEGWQCWVTLPVNSCSIGDCFIDRNFTICSALLKI